MIKKNFMTGLALLLPVIITFLIVLFIVNLLTRPFMGIMTTILNYFNLSHNQVHVLIVSKLIVLLFLILFIIFIGYIASLFFVSYLFHYSDFMLHRIPFFNKIYKVIQDVIYTLFAKNKTAFSQVVLVPYPQHNTYNIGFITKDKLPEGTSPEIQGLISIFVPGSPNPAMGFMLLFRPEQVIYLDISVEEAFKFIFSFGIITKKS